ncbi:hypothetical protein [Cupriavidus numazuensis]|uniref:Helicase/UvrB N-terminal domain-containing protein n=1 Tax=Cupriavidus numazuensis TaxID=221992 RepID=A0ABN7QC94_9BURK|nr:hypothetical protein LMG26411_08159 [Cupriavidus numazuensis]
MADHDALAALQAENARLIALLESHGIDWRLPPTPAPCIREAEPTRLSTDEKVALFRRLILRATDGVHPLDVTFIGDEDLVAPWKREALSAKALAGTLPESLTVTLANLIYFEKAQLPQPLANRLIRLAAFQNPEFYKAQAMRMSVWDKPRVIGNAENYPQHIALPRGCLDAVQELLRDNGIRCDLRDERHSGEAVDVGFVGTLRLDQEAAVAGMLQHDTGVLCAPTAFGKTITAAAMIARRGVNTWCIALNCSSNGRSACKPSSGLAKASSVPLAAARSSLLARSTLR